MLYPIWGYRQNLRVPIDQLEEQMQKVNDEIQKSAMEYARLTNLLLPEIAMETASAAARRTMGSIESPLDYGASVQIKMPLAADSLHMDAQYFSFDEDAQQGKGQMNVLKSFVNQSTSFLGSKRSNEMSSAATGQTSEQRENHGIQGTLVITAKMTHKAANVSRRHRTGLLRGGERCTFDERVPDPTLHCRHLR
jgi:hypothetical protein